MKNILSRLALVAIVAVALAGIPVSAQTDTSTNAATASAPAAMAPAKKMKPVEYRGSITAIDATSVTVTSTKKTLTMALAPETKFKKDKKTATLADFAVGDRVTGSYTMDATGAMTVHSLNKKTSKQSAPMPAASTNAAPATTPPQ